MRELELCLWLNALGSLSADDFELLDPDASPEEILSALKEEKRLTEKGEARLRRLLAQRWPAEEIEKAERTGVRLLSWCDDDYPARLRQSIKPPLALYVRGILPDMERSAAVVGTRRCSLYAKKIAEQLGASLAQAGLTVVSGGALGIDGAAHRGALSSGSPTVAVLGCGVDVPWPKQNMDIFDAMASGAGALISEYPLGSEPLAWHFPERNRIIVGLAGSLAVVESPVKGGAMITARLALELGREVWAVPGRINELCCAGSNMLLLEGASPLIDIGDYTAHLTGLGALEPFVPPALSAEDEKVLHCLRQEGEQTLDQLARKTGISASLLIQTVTLLQTSGLVYSSGGGRWSAAAPTA